MNVELERLILRPKRQKRSISISNLIFQTYLSYLFHTHPHKNSNTNTQVPGAHGWTDADSVCIPLRERRTLQPFVRRSCFWDTIRAKRPYYTYGELHGGPFGHGTMNPYGATMPGRLSAAGGDENHPVAGFWPGVRRPVVPRMMPSAEPPGSGFPYGMDLWRGQPTSAATTNFIQLGSKVTWGNHHHSIHPPYKVCPATDSPNPGRIPRRTLRSGRVVQQYGKSCSAVRIT